MFLPTKKKKKSFAKIILGNLLHTYLFQFEECSSMEMDIPLLAILQNGGDSRGEKQGNHLPGINSVCSQGRHILQKQQLCGNWGDFSSGKICPHNPALPCQPGKEGRRKWSSRTSSWGSTCTLMSCGCWTSRYEKLWSGLLYFSASFQRTYLKP